MKKFCRDERHRKKTEALITSHEGFSTTDTLYCGAKIRPHRTRTAFISKASTNSTIATRTASIIPFLFLTACFDNGSSNTPTNATPVALLAVVGEAEEGQLIVLDASKSNDADGDSLTYTFTHGGQQIGTSSDGKLNVALGHVIQDEARDYAVSVSDGKASDTASSTVRITDKEIPLLNNINTRATEMASLLSKVLAAANSGEANNHILGLEALKGEIDGLKSEIDAATQTPNNVSQATLDAAKEAAENAASVLAQGNAGHSKVSINEAKNTIGAMSSTEVYTAVSGPSPFANIGAGKAVTMGENFLDGCTKDALNKHSNLSNFKEGAAIKAAYDAAFASGARNGEIDYSAFPEGAVGDIQRETADLYYQVGAALATDFAKVIESGDSISGDANNSVSLIGSMRTNADGVVEKNMLDTVLKVPDAERETAHVSVDNIQSDLNAYLNFLNGNGEYDPATLKNPNFISTLRQNNVTATAVRKALDELNRNAEIRIANFQVGVPAVGAALFDLNITDRDDTIKSITANVPNTGFNGTIEDGTSADFVPNSHTFVSTQGAFANPGNVISITVVTNELDANDQPRQTNATFIVPAE